MYHNTPFASLKPKSRIKCELRLIFGVLFNRTFLFLLFPSRKYTPKSKTKLIFVAFSAAKLTAKNVCAVGALKVL